jgi:hypothetical protein
MLPLLSAALAVVSDSPSATHDIDPERRKCDLGSWLIALLQYSSNVLIRRPARGWEYLQKTGKNKALLAGYTGLASTASLHGKHSSCVLALSSFST